MDWSENCAGVLAAPCALGVACAQVLRWTDTVWLSTAGGFWPITLTAVSVAILIRRLFSPFSDRTIAGAAWVTLVLAWFLGPLWVTAVNVPFAAAVVSRDGHVHDVRDVARYPEYKVWFMADHRGTRTVHNVAGKIVTSSIEIDYRYADPYIATQQHKEDLSKPLIRAAATILNEEAKRPRASKIALVDDTTVQNRVIERICTETVGDRIACPLKMKLLPQNEATGLGGTWSKYYSEREAIDEKHLPTLARLLTTPDSSIADPDRVFALILKLADTVAPLSQVAQHPYFLRDEQFDELIQRILIAPDCGDEAVAILPKSNRLTAEHRSALRAKALAEASIGKIVAQAGPLHISDAEIATLAPRMQAAFVGDPGVAVRALEAFGDAPPRRDPACRRRPYRQGQGVVCPCRPRACQFPGRPAPRSHDEGAVGWGLRGFLGRTPDEGETADGPGARRDEGAHRDGSAGERSVQAVVRVCALLPAHTRDDTRRTANTSHGIDVREPQGGARIRQQKSGLSGCGGSQRGHARLQPDHRG